jgi:hypothetical protein
MPRNRDLQPWRRPRQAHCWRGSLLEELPNGNRLITVRAVSAGIAKLAFLEVTRTAVGVEANVPAGIVEVDGQRSDLESAALELDVLIAELDILCAR